jgi:hypothetical protein
VARYVLLEFDSTPQAEAFVAKTIDKTIAGAPLRVMGFFYKPTKWCGCGTLSERQVRNQVYMNKQFGIRVHRTCRRPRKEVSNAPRNLLDPIDAPGRMKTAFLTLMGDWAGSSRAGTPLINHPISVAHSEDLPQPTLQFITKRDTKKARKRRHGKKAKYL